MSSTFFLRVSRVRLYSFFCVFFVVRPDKDIFLLIAMLKKNARRYSTTVRWIGSTPGMLCKERLVGGCSGSNRARVSYLELFRVFEENPILRFSELQLAASSNFNKFFLVSKNKKKKNVPKIALDFSNFQQDPSTRGWCSTCTSKLVFRIKSSGIYTDEKFEESRGKIEYKQCTCFHTRYPFHKKHKKEGGGRRERRYPAKHKPK